MSDITAPARASTTWPPPAPAASTSSATVEQRASETHRRTLGLLLPLRWFLAAGWLRAAVEKIISVDWWTGAELDAFLAGQRLHMVDFFPSVVDAVIAPFSLPIAWIVVEMQLAIGLCLLLGRQVRLALWGGVLLNTVFVLAGAVNPSAFYLVMQLVLLLSLARAVPWRTSLGRAAGWLMGALAMLPFVRTVEPALVIDDPAAMLSFAAVLAAVGTIAIGDWHRVPAAARWRRAGEPDST